MLTEIEVLFGKHRLISQHLESRYRAIEKRVISTNDYVTPSYKNAETYSYVFASILRDIGSCFDSILRELITIEELSYSKSIGGFLDFLKQYEPDLHFVELSLNRSGSIYPFRPQSQSDSTPKWWTSYNKVKHNEVRQEKRGCLRDVYTGLGALFVLKWLVSRPNISMWQMINIPSIHGRTRDYLNDFFNP